MYYKSLFVVAILFCIIELAFDPIKSLSFSWFLQNHVTSLVRKLTKMDLNIFFADGNLGNTVQLTRETVCSTGP